MVVGVVVDQVAASQDFAQVVDVGVFEAVANVEELQADIEGFGGGAEIQGVVAEQRHDATVVYQRRRVAGAHFQVVAESDRAANSFRQRDADTHSKANPYRRERWTLNRTAAMSTGQTSPPDQRTGCDFESPCHGW